MDENAIQLEFEANDNEEYKFKGIWNSTIYTKVLDAGYLLRLYYLVFWKSYLEEEDTWKSSLTVMHLQKIVNTFHKDHLGKLIVTSPPLDSALPMAKLIIKLFSKKKWE